MIPPGIYFNLPNETYQADPALGSGDHKAILGNPVQWHSRKRNAALMELLTPEEPPEKVAKKEAGKAYGECLHTLLLDGQEAFDAKYADDPEAPELPKTKEELSAAILSRGVIPPKASAKREEFLAFAKHLGITTADDWAEERATILGGRMAISPRWRTILTLTRAIMDRHPSAGRYLRGGRSEVSVFWEVDGLRLKARFDYLLPRPLPDLKTYAGRDGIDPIEAFAAAVQTFAYDMQAAHYMEARTAALPDLVEAGKIYDCSGPDGAMVDVDEADIAFLDKVAATENPRWVWIAIMTGGLPEVDVVEFPSDLLQFSASRVQVEEARRIYREYRTRFGDADDEIWLSDRGLVRLTDASFGMRAAIRGAPTWERGE